MAGIKVGDTVYFLENNQTVREAVVVRKESGFSVLRYGSGKGTRLRDSRLFSTKEEAENALPRKSTSISRMGPYDFWY